MKNLLTALFFLLVFILPSRAKTFIVTTNADAGPGSLREAIEKANNNGTGETDYIHFNIADQSIAGRTIWTNSEYPDLLSNLVIDASTQAGAKIGVSDAKIRISTFDASLGYVFRIMDHENISIYGMHFDNVTASPTTGYFFSCIALWNARSVTIGAPGKGNYFTHVARAVGDALTNLPKGMADGIYLRSNILNLSADGNSIISNGILLSLDNVKNLDIGGDDPADGNFLVGTSPEILWTDTDLNENVNTGTYRILNNKLGCNYEQTAELKCGAIYLQNGNSYNLTDTTRIIIKNNSYNSGVVVGSNWLQTFIKIHNKKGSIEIKGNKVGMMTQERVFYSNVLYAFEISLTDGGVIGGDAPEDANIISGCSTAAIGLNDNKAFTITKNSIYCNRAGIVAKSSLVTVPVTKIFSIGDYEVKGTTLPMSRVEVFLTRKCSSCDNGEIFLGFTTADANGDWRFTSPVMLDGAVTATGTGPDGTTGEFAKPGYRFEGMPQIVYPTCGKNIGSIKGVRFDKGTAYYWVRQHAGGIDTLYTEDIENLGPGTYKFVVEQGSFCSTSYDVMLYDLSPRIKDAYKYLTHPSCGGQNGQIFNVNIEGSYNKIIWKNALGQEVGHEQDLNNVPPGQYKLIVLDTLHGCGDSTAYYTLTNQSGPSLKNDNLQITSATCELNNGSIRGITAENVQGNASIQWEDSTGTIVGSGFDLLNAYPGKYRMKFKDAGGCDTIVVEHTIPNTGAIQIDTTGLVVNASTCRGADGSVLNMTVTGATSFEWRNIEENRVVAQTREAVALAAGNYQLIASNEAGCSRTSPVITVPQKDFDVIVVQRWDTKPASCGFDNGYIDITEFSADTAGYTFRWTDSTTQNLAGNYSSIQDLAGGSYQLYAKDKNGCEKQILSQVVPVIPAPTFDTTAVKITDDVCSTGSGRIQYIRVVNQGAATTFSWASEAGQQVGNSIDAINLGAGNYLLTATDGNGCTISTGPVAVGNKDQVLAAPAADGQTVVKGTAATIQVKNVSSGTYQFFDAAAATVPVWQSTTGTFKTPPLTESQTFYVQLVQGSCSSAKAPVPIEVLSKQGVYIPTGFTPNNDGKNDRFKATVMGFLKSFELVVYNRWGQVVFRTVDPGRGWDGKVEKVEQGNFVYVWTCRYQFDGEPEKFEKGIVTVIR